MGSTIEWHTYFELDNFILLYWILVISVLLIPSSVSGRRWIGAVVVANLIPLVGHLVFGWTLAVIVLCYVLEAVCFALDLIGRILCARADPEGVTPATLVTVESRLTPVPIQIFHQNVQTALIVSVVFGILLLLYGGTVIIVVSIEQSLFQTATEAAIAVTSLALLRLGSFGQYLASGSFDGVNLMGETKRVISYLVVFHFALILAGVLLIAVEFIAIVVLIAIKLAVELYLFSASRESSASGDDSDWTGDDSDWTGDDSDWTGGNSTSVEADSTGEDPASATWNPAPTDPVTWYPIDRRTVWLVAASNAIAIIGVLAAGWSIGIVFALFLFEFAAACGFTIARIYAGASPESENRFLPDQIARGVFLGKMVAVAGVVVSIGVGGTALVLGSDPQLVIGPAVVATLALACVCSFAGYALAAPIGDPSVPDDWEELPNPFVTLLAVVPAVVVIAIIWFVQLPTVAIAGAIVFKAAIECNEYLWAHNSVVQSGGVDSPGTAE